MAEQTVGRLDPRPGDRLRLVSVYPELLGTYGDRGNVLVLAARARARGVEVEVVEVAPLAPVPSQGDLYVLGGGEDAAQSSAVAALAEDGGLAAAAASGAVLLAVCAGVQMLGERFVAGGADVPGLGIIDATSTRMPRRAVGELVVEADPGLHVPLLSGYENHGGGTTRGPLAEPLGRVVRGAGNGEGTEGVRQGRVYGTYLHGPVLARNAAFADHLLGLVLGTLAPLDDTLPERLRRERLTAVLGSAAG
ncbi:MAG: type 1 glutamine amidotransferase [Actinomycetes bacterium]